MVWTDLKKLLSIDFVQGDPEESSIEIYAEPQTEAESDVVTNKIEESEETQTVAIVQEEEVIHVLGPENNEGVNFTLVCLL